MNQAKLTQGFALMTVVVLVIVMMALATAYFFLTNLELATTRASASSTTGFYAAEAGLNVRGEEIRAKFQGGDRPTGKVFSVGNACKTTADYTPQNSIDSFYCKNYSLNGRKVVTYVVQDPANTDPTNERRTVTLQAPDTFAGLNAIEYRYEVLSESYPPNETRPEARLGMVFRSRLIPVFQFAAFYDKDLEIAPGADMTLNGRVHTNGDLYLEAGATLNITGPITVAASKTGVGGGDLYRRRKDNSNCGGTVRIKDAKDLTVIEPALPCSGLKSQSVLTPTWDDRVLTKMDTITAPNVSSFDIGGDAWNQSDLRIALDMRTGSSTYQKVIVPNALIASGNPQLLTNNTSLTNQLENCKDPVADMTKAQDRAAINVNKTQPRPYKVDSNPSDSDAEFAFSGSDSQIRVAEGSKTFYDRRENKQIVMLEIDARRLIECLFKRKNQLFDTSPSLEKNIDDTSQGGLVIYLTVIGPNSSSSASGYGVRIRNGAQLKATSNNAPEIKGLTIVSDQALYVMGDYNREGSSGDVWKPASFLVDSLNILSKAWDTGYLKQLPSPATGDDVTDVSWGKTSVIGKRLADSTQINVAFLSGTDITGGFEGSGGQNKNLYNGGLENYPRLHENWAARLTPAPAVTPTLTYKGSFVSLGKPRHASGQWPNTGTVYNAPVRNWSYDERFNDPEQLPPLAPRFVYLRQELFSRNFTR